LKMRGYDNTTSTIVANNLSTLQLQITVNSTQKILRKRLRSSIYLCKFAVDFN